MKTAKSVLWGSFSNIFIKAYIAMGWKRRWAIWCKTRVAILSCHLSSEEKTRQNITCFMDSATISDLIKSGEQRQFGVELCVGVIGDGEMILGSLCPVKCMLICIPVWILWCIVVYLCFLLLFTYCSLAVGDQHKILLVSFPVVYSNLG